MRAARYLEHGAPDVVKITEVDELEAGPGQVLVEVHAASINPFDAKLRAGVTGIKVKFPFTPGSDFAGIVKAAGSGVTSVKPGDKVYGQGAGVAGDSGTFAEFATTKEGKLAPAPTSVDFVTAGALPLVGVSAWQALHDHLELQSGQKLLIHGGTGAIGSIAVQIAKHIGAHVAVTTSGGDKAYAKEIGADVVIDYETEKFEDKVHDYDAVFDTAGGDVFERSLAVLKRGGRAVSMAAPANEERAAELGVTAQTQKTVVTTERLNALTELVDGGHVKVRIDSTFPLDQTAEAFKKQESRPRGKVVIKIKD
jgi:NADPH:quinone reductase-like Zn-dependent oxidoreductase